jgi:hypothetical protein
MNTQAKPQAAKTAMLRIVRVDIRDDSVSEIFETGGEGR